MSLRNKLFQASFLSFVALLLMFVPTSAAEMVAGLDDLASLDFTISETVDGEKTTYRFRYDDIGTEKEVFRADMTESDGSVLVVILKKKDRKVIVKDVDQDRWQIFPAMTFERTWSRWVAPYVALPTERSATWSEIAGEEFLVELEGKTLRIYDIRVDETFEESVFNPN